MGIFFFVGSTPDPNIWFLFPSHREPGNALEITVAQDDIRNLLEHPPSVGVPTPGFGFSGRELKPGPFEQCSNSCH